MDMKLRSLIASISVLLLIAGIGAPAFQSNPECKSIRSALEEDRVYFDFGPEVRLRLTSLSAGMQVALRGQTGFDSNDTLERFIGEGQALLLTALESGSARPAVTVFVRNTHGGPELIAAYHRAQSALVVSSFDGAEVSCQRLSNAAALEYVADIARAADAASLTLRFASTDLIASQFGL